MPEISSTNSTCPAPNEFSCGVRIGHVLIVQSASLSLIACVTLLSYIAYNGLRNIFNPPAIGQKRWFFLRTAVDHYLLSLFVGDILMALGSLMHIRWISIAGLEDGSYCTTQAALKQIGDVCVALSAMCIAIHTFLVLFLRCKLPQGRLMPMAVLALVWLIIILITVIPSQIHKNAETPYYGKTVHWCSIDEQYDAERIGLLWGIFWLAAAVNVFLYVPLFLFLRGYITVNRNYTDPQNNRPRLKITWNRVRSGSALTQHKEKREEATVIARSMLWYPIMYIILITPLAIVRFIQFYNKKHPSGEEHSASNAKVPYEWTAFAAVIFNSSGLVNVILYATTRPSLFPWFKRSGGSCEESEDYQLEGVENVATTQVPTTGTQPTTHRSAQSHDHRAHPTALPVPMLTDDDDDDGHFQALNSSTSYGQASMGQATTTRNSRASRTSESGYGGSVSATRAEV